VNDSGEQYAKIIVQMGRLGSIFPTIMPVPAPIAGEKMVLLAFLIIISDFVLLLLFGMEKIRFLKKDCLV
jgi:hypothetical protein